jgi:pimeloyl-ACP methyl ester carboxylesterase
LTGVGGRATIEQHLNKNPMIVKQALAVFSPPDQELLRRADFQPRFIAMFREAHRQGARGSVLDQALMVSPWGFDPHQIAVPTHICVGEDDQHAPSVMARYLAEAIPGADLHVMPGVGHVSVFCKHAPGILKTLVAQP